MSSSSTLYNSNHHANHVIGQQHNHHNSNSPNHIIVNHSPAMYHQHRNSPNPTNQNSFIFTPQLSQAPSPTISLMSSSSSSPTSSSSSPTQLSFNNPHNSNMNKTQQSSQSNNIFNGIQNSSNISAAKKTAALQSIAASIARSQQLQQTANSAAQSQLANKILALTLENNGVAASIVKSNTNIYYNSKVDTAASKAIHYCTQCTNPDCKAIHKSLTKPLINNNGNLNVSQSTQLPMPLMAQSLSNSEPSSANTSSSQQQQLARMFLTSKLEQLEKQSKLPKTPIDSTSRLSNDMSPKDNQFNKLLGANVNFIFERRYPLVQLNSNFFNISASNPNGGSTESLINFINNAGQSSLLSPMTTSALLNGSNFHNNSSNRNILQYRGGTNQTHSQNLFLDEDNASINSQSMSPKATMSFPLPISPPVQQNDPTKSPPKATSFSVNYNNNIGSSSNSSSPSSVSSNSSNSLTNNNGIVRQQTMQSIDDPISLNQQQNEINEPFPGLNRLENLRYKNIMFLDQFNKDELQQQRSQSPRETDKQTLKINSINSINNTVSAQSAQKQPVQINFNNGNKPKEKEIQIQRVTTSPVVDKTQKEKSNGSVNYIDLQVINKDQTNINSKTNSVQSLTPAASQTISTSPLPTTNIEFSNNKSPISTALSTSLSLHDQSKSKSLTSPVKTLNKILAPKVHVPQFYYPNGKPDEKPFKEDPETMKLVSAEFRMQKDGKMFKDKFAEVVKLIGLPKYWKQLLFKACTQYSKLTHVTYPTFEQVWSKLNLTCHDRPSLFLKLIASSGNSIVYDDWETLMQDIVDTHPGLKFLHDHKEFHTRYIKTVIARIYYTVNRSWSGKITLMELKRSNFLSVLESLEFEDDINLIKDYFSYEHFYVIYCKFWELDKDHDLFITKEDLYRHNNFAITPRVIDRIFSGTVIRGKDWREGLMSYYDFVWFLISEEDKRNTTSIEYWFRILDLDGDGVLSMYELEYFYNEQIEQMRERNIEYMPFTDLLCQILYLVKPSESGKIHLKDLKQCKMTNVFFDTFINLEKYLEYEQRDPFSNMRDLDGPELSDWEKYAADEYENLVSEDVNADNQDAMYNNYEDDFEDDHFYTGAVQANNNNGVTNLGNASSGIGSATNNHQANNRNVNRLINSSTSMTSPSNGTSSFISNRLAFEER